MTISREYLDLCKEDREYIDFCLNVIKVDIDQAFAQLYAEKDFRADQLEKLRRESELYQLLISENQDAFC